MAEWEARPSSPSQCQGKTPETPETADVPQWLNEIIDNTFADSENERPDRVDSASQPSNLLHFGLHLHDADVPNSSDRLILSRPNSSARFGRRAPSQVGEEGGEPKMQDHELERKRTVSTMHYEDKLEKSWHGLSKFQQSHKGRLDSAKLNIATGRRRLSDRFEATLAPLSPSHSVISPTECTYGPSACDTDVPNIRSRSEMSTYMPQYVDSRERHDIQPGVLLTERMLSKTINNFNTLSKSKSTENIFTTFSARTRRQDFHGSEESLSASRLSGYKLRVARENELRQQIINELLLENEKIASSRKEAKAQLKSSDDTFIIPELPSGRQLRITILTTWGDKYYVGLNGVELFGEDGKIIQVDKISSSPSDVNDLPECSNDPRVVSNLLDGINRTQDDVHLWLAPFTKGAEHIIDITFKTANVVAMIRFWNYNKSRIHSYRGAKDVVMELDGRRIFVGEIAKACGGIIGGVDAFGDTILFTVNEDILEAISQNDHAYPTLTSAKIDSPSIDVERPLTSALNTSNGIRPYTGMNHFKSDYEFGDCTDQILLGCKRLDIVLISNWGFADVIGLTGIEIIEAGDLPVPIRDEYIQSGTSANRLLQRRLFDEENVTTDQSHMWHTHCNYGQHIKLTLAFDRQVYIAGLRIWNYNADLELAYAGVSRLKIFLDDRPVANPRTKDAVFLLRRAPGNVNYDFVQEILFGDGSSLVHRVELTPSFIISSSLSNAHDCPILPEGFVLEIVVYSTWGDQYYCGLNGLVIYDHKGRKLMLDESNICAYPESINVLPDITGDVRTPDKLIDNINDDNDGLHSWLAPVIPKSLNRIYVVLDHPVMVSVIKFWNYSKNPSRGVKEFGILLDDLLIYNGVLDKASSRDACKYRTVVFTDDLKVVERESSTLIKPSSNITMRTATGGSLPSADPALRPFTAVSPFTRTSQSQ